MVGLSAISSALRPVLLKGIIGTPDPHARLRGHLQVYVRGTWILASKQLLDERMADPVLQGMALGQIQHYDLMMSRSLDKYPKREPTTEIEIIRYYRRYRNG